MSKTRRRMLTALAALLAALLVCTFLSRTISELMLPVVELGSPSKGTLGQALRLGGVVSLPGPEEYTVGFAAELTELFVENGQEVKKGDPLFSFKSEEMEIYLAEQRLAVNMLERTLEDMRRSGLSQDSASRLNAQDQLNIARRKHALLVEKLPVEGVVYAEEDGTVSDLKSGAGARVAATEAVLRVRKSWESVQVKLTLDSLAARSVAEAGRITAELTGKRGGQGELRTETAQAVVMEDMLASSGLHEITLKVSTGLWVNDGDRVNVVALKSGETYDFIVPKSSVVSVEYGKFVYTAQEVPGVFGPENRIELLAVTILDEDAYSYAVSMAMPTASGPNNVVLSATKPLSPGQKVRVG